MNDGRDGNDELVDHFWPRLGAAVRQRRLMTGKKVGEIARLADVSKSMWEQIERGTRRLADGRIAAPNPRPANITRIAAAIDVDPSLLAEAASGELWAIEDIETLGPPKPFSRQPDDPLPASAAASSADVIDVSGLPAEDVALIRSQIDRLKQLHGIDD